MRPSSSSSSSSTASLASRLVAAFLVAMALLAAIGPMAECGGKGKGKGEDIILYNGNIVMRGDKKGGSIVLANQHQNHHEEVEYMPNFFEHGFDHHRR